MGSCSSRSSTVTEPSARGVIHLIEQEGRTAGSDDTPFPTDEPTYRRLRNPRPRLNQFRMNDDEERLQEIMALQQSLSVMEDFFQSIWGHAPFYVEAMDPQNSGGASGPPPASKRVLDALPDITAEGAHVLCGVCGEHGANTRLPCGHAYHKTSCIEIWLNRHCTCPVCRYELPTDDECYEPGRMERMSTRKSFCPSLQQALAPPQQ